MHERGVVHRDMNPTNVFITDEETKAIKLLDFNVSKLIEKPKSQRQSLDLIEDGEKLAKNEEEEKH